MCIKVKFTSPLLKYVMECYENQKNEKYRVRTRAFDKKTRHRILPKQASTTYFRMIISRILVKKRNC